MAAGKSAPPPPGFNEFAEELSMFRLFQRITSYNYSVFGEFYHKVLNDSMSSSDAATSSSSAPDTTQVPAQTPSNGSSSTSIAATSSSAAE